MRTLSGPANGFDPDAQSFIESSSGATDTLQWILSDHLNSASVTANADGTWNSTIQYTAFGEVRASKGLTATKYRYTGQLAQDSLGLDYYVARWYDPVIGHFTSADIVVPEPGKPRSFDRYSYVYNNPIQFSDPTGHWPDFSPMGEFFTGLSFEFTRTNNWMGAMVSPDMADTLAPNINESDAMMAGRIVGDVLTIAVGVVEVAGGIAVGGGGAVAGCGATLCLASAPAIAAGVIIGGYGVTTTLSGAAGLGENLGRVYSTRKKNDLKPDPNATGPHSTYKKDPLTGKTTNYETYQPQTNPKNPNKWEKIIRYDELGKPHRDSVTKDYIIPHVHDFIMKIVREPKDFEIP